MRGGVERVAIWDGHVLKGVSEFDFRNKLQRDSKTYHFKNEKGWYRVAAIYGLIYSAVTADLVFKISRPNTGEVHAVTHLGVTTDGSPTCVFKSRYDKTANGATNEQLALKRIRSRLVANQNSIFIDVYIDFESGYQTNSSFDSKLNIVIDNTYTIPSSWELIENPEDVTNEQVGGVIYGLAEIELGANTWMGETI